MTADASGAAWITFTADAAGTSTVTFTVVTINGGIVVNTAVSGSVTIDVIAGEVDILDSLTATSGFAAWIGDGESTAAEIFAAVAGTSIVWFWDGTQWQPYAVLAGGVELPGSLNFDVTLDAILFFG